MTGVGYAPHPWPLSHRERGAESDMSGQDFEPRLGYGIATSLRSSQLRGSLTGSGLAGVGAAHGILADC